jgi:hypothetical protein
MRLHMVAVESLNALLTLSLRLLYYVDCILVLYANTTICLYYCRAILTDQFVRLKQSDPLWTDRAVSVHVLIIVIYSYKLQYTMLY